MARTDILQNILELNQKVIREYYNEISGENEGQIDYQERVRSSEFKISSKLKESSTSKLKSKGKRIAIIGAGLSGLTCAYRLNQSGIKTEIFEASNRLGGRCWTLRNYFDDGQIAEHGGELIDEGHISIRKLVRELDLVLDNIKVGNQNGTKEFLYFMTEKYDKKTVIADLKMIWPKLHSDLFKASFPTRYYMFTQRGRELDAMSIDQWINESVPGGLNSKLGKLLSIAYTVEFGVETNKQSALNLVYLMGYSETGQINLFGPSDEKYKIKGGNDLLITKLSESLTERIQLNHFLTSITKNVDESFSLTFENGQIKTFDFVVLAIPFSILREKVDFSDAGFSSRKIKAINELGFGASTKLTLQFNNRYWNKIGNNGDSYTDTGYQITYEATIAQKGSPGILVNYTGGSIAKEFESDNLSTHVNNFFYRSSIVLPGLNEIFNGKAYIDCWSNNQMSMGSYSFYKPGQYVAFGGVECEREGNCFFAGEHTSQNFQGFLNGAVETGEKVAADLAKELS